MQSQSGFSLLEVMIAGVVTSLGLAGTAALLLTGVLTTAGAADRTQAVLLAEEMGELIALSPSALDAHLAGPPETAPGCAAPSSCTAGQFAAAAALLWHSDVATRLPQGSGRVCRDTSPHDGEPGAPACSGAGPVVVKVFWSDRHGERPEGRRYALVVAS